ncbi:MAG: cytochrome c3 family protein [Anaerolineales bacterium]|nr:cytochrome c3 family protein [Anaerolineales bacterium]MCB8940202.1 cytochrome c3 family protein [Ardenticatenaceae bacterium]
MRQYRRLERQHPIFSPVALISTFILAVGLAVWVYLTGGRAFSPGELSALNHSGEPIANVMSHADIADDCSQCHAPFAGVQDVLCQDCHENIGVERAGDGLHGRLPDVEQCGTCHLEHLGHDYDLKTAAVADFDHDLTRFSLAHHDVKSISAEMACTDCHTDEGSYTIADSTCATCHRDLDGEFMAQHDEAYGANCLNCHDGLDSMSDFTMTQHAELFALTGAHESTRCESCHAGGEFEGTPHECVACHTEPEKHLAMFGTNCAECHATVAWQPAKFDDAPFDHERTTTFSLTRHVEDFDGSPMACTHCHTGDEPIQVQDATCEECHATAVPTFITEHTALFGSACQDCHDGLDSMANFDHGTVFPLDGQHATVECTACHVNQVFQGTPKECVACHAEPEIHFGIFGTDCANCHTVAGWLPAQLRQHTFPLDHGEQGTLECTACHTGTSYTAYDCTTCHEHNVEQVQAEHSELAITQAELFACAACHPTGHTEEAEHDD